MRTALFLATLTLIASAARAQQPAPAPAQGAVPGQRPTPGEEKSPVAGEAGTPPPVQPVQSVGEEPSLPAGATPAEAGGRTADSGVFARVNVQGNRRVDADAIRAVLPLKPGDLYDREKLKST